MGFGKIFKGITNIATTPISIGADFASNTLKNPLSLLDPGNITNTVQKGIGETGVAIGSLFGIPENTSRKAMLGFSLGGPMGAQLGAGLGFLKDEKIKKEIENQRNLDETSRLNAAKDLETLALANSLSGRLAQTSQAGSIELKELPGFGKAQGSFSLTDIEQRVKAISPDSEVGKKIQEQAANLIAGREELFARRAQLNTRLSLVG